MDCSFQHGVLFCLRYFGYDQALRGWIDGLRPDDPLTDPDGIALWAGVSAKVEFAKYFERDHPYVEAARTALGIPAGQMNDIWMFGAN